MNTKLSPPTPKRLSHARDIAARGYVLKLILMALVNAFGIYGIMSSWAHSSYGILAFLVLALFAADYIYFSKRAIALKYLYPGLIFLIVYQLYVMANTAYVAFTNYGDGHNDAKAPAIEQILKTADRRVAETETYPVTILGKGETIGLAIVTGNEVKVGDGDTPLAVVHGATHTGSKVTAVPGWQVLGLAQIQSRQNDLLALRVNMSSDPNDGWLRTDNGTSAYVAKSLLKYDATADTFTTAEGLVYTANNKVGVYEAADGSRLTPGWRVTIGFENFTKMITDKRLAEPFLKVLIWTFAFAVLSVLTTFALGLFLAVVFNDPRVRARRFYRAMFVLPYAFPAFLSALVWKGMFNKDFGIINQTLLGGSAINWLGDPTLAKVTVLLVNLWLGFPYMFLICTGALQSIPGELTEAGVMDGAGPWRRFRSITFPLLLVSVGPLLIASFAFNFNNFSLIYMLTGGGPNIPGAPILVGDTDILISMVYAVAFESGVKQYGLASALSIIIFVLVGLISWLGFRQTRKLEEIL